MSDKSDNPLVKIGGVFFDTAESLAGEQLEKHPAKPLAICGVKTLKIFFEHHADTGKAVEKTAAATKVAMQFSQASLGALQTTTALIGATAAVSTVLTAVNLYQTLKLRDDIKNLKREVKEGFADLKEDFEDFKEHVQKGFADAEFGHHYSKLSEAYNLFLKAKEFITDAVEIRDKNTRISQLGHVQQTLGNALAIYDDRNLLKDVPLISQLRRRECSWITEQTIALTYQLQDEFGAAHNRLSSLSQKICEDCKEIANNCTSEIECDILFPEILRIYWCDLPTLTFWQDGLNQLQMPSEIRSIQNTYLPPESSDEDEFDIESESTIEEKYYDEIKRRSHSSSLNDQLRMIMNSELRQEQIDYVSIRSREEGHKALTSENLSYASNMTIANLYWYFKSR